MKLLCLILVGCLIGCGDTSSSSSASIDNSQQTRCTERRVVDCASFTVRVICKENPGETLYTESAKEEDCGTI